MPQVWSVLADLKVAAVTVTLGDVCGLGMLSGTTFYTIMYQFYRRLAGVC